MQHVKHAEDLWTKLQAPQVPVPAHVVRAKTRLLRVLLTQLESTAEAVESYREAIADFFGSLPSSDNRLIYLQIRRWPQPRREPETSQIRRKVRFGWEAGIRTLITRSRAARPTVERPPSKRAVTSRNRQL